MTAIVRLALMALMALAALMFLAAALPPLARAQSPAVAHLTKAVLVEGAVERPVALPHVLKPAEVGPDGARVRYRVIVELPEPPNQEMGVYVGKASLSSALRLNGHWVGQCAHGALEQMRCLHRPLLFRPPPALWQAGRNVLEFELYADPRRVLSGLSDLRVGPAELLYRTTYSTAYWWRVTVKEWMALAGVLLGAVSLIVAARLRDSPVYLFYGLTGVLFAISFLNVVADETPLSAQVFSWVVTNSRLGASLAYILTLLALFQKLRSWHWKTALLYAGLAGALSALDDHRLLVSAIFLPVLVVIVAAVPVSIRWALASRSHAHAMLCLAIGVSAALGLRDLLNFVGVGGFEFTFVAPYGFAATVVITGFVAADRIVGSLKLTQELTRDLQSKVFVSTTQLHDALKTLRDLERTALRLTEAIPVGTFVAELTPQRAVRLPFVSNRLLQMLELEREVGDELPGLALQRIHPEDRARFLAGFGPAVADAPFSWEGRVVLGNAVRWLNLESVPRRLEDGTSVYEGVVVDVTARRNALAALEATHHRDTELAVMRARARDREQLLRDMHDGFGSQLASARYRVRKGELSSEEVAALLQECMDDLHLVVDSLGEGSRPLLHALSDQMYRLQKRMQDSGVSVHWRIAIEEDLELPPSTSLHVLRIIQEALVNALKHAQASRIEVDVDLDESRQHLRVRVRDDGLGFSRPPASGRGLNNMQTRARLIGAALEIDGAAGTCVSLKVSLLAVGLA